MLFCFQWCRWRCPECLPILNRAGCGGCGKMSQSHQQWPWHSSQTSSQHVCSVPCWHNPCFCCAGEVLWVYFMLLLCSIPVDSCCVSSIYKGLGLPRGGWIPDIPLLKWSWYPQSIHLPHWKIAKGGFRSCWRILGYVFCHCSFAVGFSNFCVV